MAQGEPAVIALRGIGPTIETLNRGKQEAKRNCFLLSRAGMEGVRGGGQREGYCVHHHFSYSSGTIRSIYSSECQSQGVSAGLF